MAVIISPIHVCIHSSAMWLCSSPHQARESVSPSLGWRFGFVTCFGQWDISQCDTSQRDRKGLKSVCLLGLIFSCCRGSVCPYINKPGLTSWRMRDPRDRIPGCLSHPSQGPGHGSEVLVGHLAPAKPTQARRTVKLTQRFVGSDKCCFRLLCFGVVCYIAKANSYGIYSLSELFTPIFFLLIHWVFRVSNPNSCWGPDQTSCRQRICLYLWDRINCSFLHNSVPLCYISRGTLMPSFIISLLSRSVFPSFTKLPMVWSVLVWA